jgi:peptide deformylase
MLKIVLEPNQILHTKTKRVDVIDNDIAKIADQMFITMKKANGIGLAAPQVNIDKQIAIVDVNRDDNDTKSNLIVMINPKIIQASQSLSKMNEGCLSIPGIEVEVTRPASITVTFQDLESRKVTLKANELLARAIQHEVDHLNGILITDHGIAKPIENHD